MPTASTAADEVLVQLCHDLRVLREQAGGPSIRALAAAAGLGKSQTGAILTGRIRRPPHWGVLRSLVTAIYLYAHDCGRTHQLSIRSGLDEYWRPRHAMVEQAFSQPILAPHDAVLPRQLPGDVLAFTGRSAALAQLDRMLDDVGTCLVIGAVSGIAGVGKTALAIQWAHRIRGRFPDGQLFVNLRGYDAGPPVDPGQALAQFLRALAVPAQRVPFEVDEAAAMYRSLLADKRMVIVLDNAAGPEQVRPLLPGSPRCLVLITSRNRLAGLIAGDGAQLLALDVLDAAEAHALLTGILDEQRTRSDEPAVAELARLCGFLPLALRIAAANLTVNPRQSIADYVTGMRGDNRLARLQIDGDERVAVRSAFDLSYVGLEPGQQHLFRLLGLVPGPDIDLGGAAALAGMSNEDTLRTLRRLVLGHLVEDHENGRFGLHDLLRTYARSLSAAQDSPEQSSSALQRLYSFYLSAADHAASLVHPESVRVPGPASGQPPPVLIADRTQALQWLDSERENLAALIHRGAESGPRSAAWRLADAMRGYFFVRGHAPDRLAVAADGLRAAELEGHLAAQAAAHLSLGVAHNVRGAPDLAIAHLSTALALAERADWLDGQAAARNNLGTVYERTGRPKQAAEYFGQAAELFKRTGRRLGQAAALENLAMVYRALGQLKSAAALHIRAMDLFEQAGHPLGRATGLTLLGDVYRDLGLLNKARQHHTQGHLLHNQIGNHNRQAMSLCAMAMVHHATGRYTRALRLANDALAIAEDIADHRTQARARVTLGSAYHRLGRHQCASEQHQQALRVARDTSDLYFEAAALIGLADVQLSLDGAKPALATIRHALAIIRHAGFRLLEVDARTVLGEIHNAHDCPHRATAMARAALAIRRRTGYRLGHARTARTLHTAVILQRHSEAGRKPAAA